MATINGRVKWFNAQKRYGYITDDQGVDHFVHASGITSGRMYPGFQEGDCVSFEVVEGKKGPQATNVVLTQKVEDVRKAEKEAKAETADAEATEQE